MGYFSKNSGLIGTGSVKPTGVHDIISSKLNTAKINITSNGTVYYEGDTINFSYTGAEQSFTTDSADLEVSLVAIGAQGGKDTGGLSLGGSATSTLVIPGNTTVYVYVGGQGSMFTYGGSSHSSAVHMDGGWNGGGGIYNSAASHSAGGGATDFCLTSSAMTITNYKYVRSSASYLSRFLVAGGGCGTNCCWQTQAGHGGGASGTGVGPGGQTGITGSPGHEAPGFGYGATARGNSGGGAGGGGGWYGGQGTGYGNWASGSGGGSGYVYTPTSYTPANYSIPTSYYATANTLTAGYSGATGDGSASVTIVGAG